MTLERERAPKRKALFERLGAFSWNEWEAQSDEEAGRNIDELTHRRRLAIEFYDLISDDSEMVVALDKEGNFRDIHSIDGGPFYLEVSSSGESSVVTFFLRYYLIRATAPGAEN
ncbi:MAG: hypothetical protein Q8Q41_04750 [bacterium]|nr:hypothetical protein [bacterium]